MRRGPEVARKQAADVVRAFRGGSFSLGIERRGGGTQSRLPPRIRCGAALPWFPEYAKALASGTKTTASNHAGERFVMLSPSGVRPVPFVVVFLVARNLNSAKNDESLGSNANGGALLRCYYRAKHLHSRFISSGYGVHNLFPDRLQYVNWRKILLVELTLYLNARTGVGWCCSHYTLTAARSPVAFG